MEEENVRNLMPALSALGKSLQVQADSMNSVIEGELLPSTIEDRDAEFSTDFGSFEVFNRIEEQLVIQTDILTQILGIQKNMLSMDRSQMLADARKERLASVTDQPIAPDAPEKDDKDFDLSKAFGNLKSTLKGNMGGALMTALLGTALPDFVSGIVESFFGEERAEEVKGFIDNFFTPEVVGTSAVGFLLGGPRGALLGFIFSNIREKVDDWLTNTFELDPKVADTMSVIMAGLATAMLTKTGRSLMKNVAKGAASLIGIGGGAAVAAGAAGAGAAAAGAGADDKDKDGKEKGKKSRTKARGRAGLVAAAAGLAGMALMDNATDEDAVEDDGMTVTDASINSAFMAPALVAAAKTNPINEGPGEKAITPTQKANVAKMSDADLEKQGVKRTQTPSGTRYRSATTGKFVSQTDVAKMSDADKVAKASARFPRFGALTKALGPAGAAFGIVDIAMILMDDSLSESERNLALTKSIGVSLGGTGGAIGGGALGSLIFPGVGTVIGGLFGGVGGALLGEELAEQAAPWILGEKVDSTGVETAIIEAQNAQTSESVAATSSSSTQAPAASQTSSSVTPASEVSSSDTVMSQVAGATTITPAASAVNTSMAKATEIEYSTVMYGGTSNAVVPVINSGGNVTNNRGGDSTSTTINIMSGAEKALSNAVPIPMTAMG